MKNDSPKIIALLLAGGYGLRMQSRRPKQFIETDGESILLHTMKAFERHPLVGEIWVVCSPEWANYVDHQAHIGHISKFRHTIKSGKTSHESLINGIQGLETAGTGQDCVIMVHESVRPFISHEIISNNILTCIQKGNAVTALFSHESYLRTEDGKTSQGYVSRESLMRAQTPITFRMADLTTIAERAKDKGITDSQSLFTLVNEIGWAPLHIVEGNMLNYKITLPMDVEIYNRMRTINYD